MFLSAVLIFSYTLLLATACTNNEEHKVGSLEPGSVHGKSVQHEEKAEHTEKAEDGTHEGHAHGESSDLDRPVEDLLNDACEHGMKTYECDECRYEVGVVKVPSEMLEQGLIKTVTVEKRNFDSELSLTGEIAFDERRIAHLSPSTSGAISHVAVGLGQKVKAGETLLEIESSELAEAQATYLEALAENNLFGKALERQKNLHSQSVTSEREFLEAQQQYDSALIRSDSARQKLIRLGLSENNVATLEKTGPAGASGKLPLPAPFAGEIIEMHAVRGEMLEPGDDVIMIGDNSTLWIWVDLYESLLASVRQAMNVEGLPVWVAVKAYPDERFKGRLDFVGRTMERHTRTVKSRVIIENPDGRLKPGMFAEVRISLNAENSRNAVPSTAVLEDEGRNFVFVHQKDDFYVRRPVKVGRQMDAYCELLEGPETGSTVVSAGAFLLKSDVLRSKMGEGCAH